MKYHRQMTLLRARAARVELEFAASAWMHDVAVAVVRCELPRPEWEVADLMLEREYLSMLCVPYSSSVDPQDIV